jgi:tRNA G18 (ribose-2'-O)-methylase SpoU
MAEKFILVLPDIRSAHNVGAMFRTADGAGVNKIYLCGFTAQPPHPRLDKVSLGAEKSVAWEYGKQAASVVKRLKKAGYYIVALEQAPKSVSIYKWQLPKSAKNLPLALVVGNEKTGVSKAILKLCDALVHLPMQGSKNSLNVSVAAGIALYHLAFVCNQP